jgi:2'-5' RNA ligase
MRLFVALEIPDSVAAGLFLLQGGVPGARWQTRAQLHLTLRFIGEVEGHVAEAVDDALAAIRAPGFTLQLKGVGEFGGRNPHALWAGAAASEGLTHLQRKIETALQRAGLPPDPRKFTPHVTLARLRGTQAGAVMDFLTDHGLYAGEPFPVTAFTLFSSTLAPKGSLYTPERRYPLEG